MLGVGAVFAEYSEHLEKEAEVKENLRLTIKELEQAARDIHTLLQRVHRPGGVRDTPALVTAARGKFADIARKYRWVGVSIWRHYFTYDGPSLLIQ